MKVLVTGGAGHLGRALQRTLIDAGHTVRILSRRQRSDRAPEAVEWARGDIATGGGLQAAVEGIDAIIHAASDPARARAVDVGGTRMLVDTARSAGISNFFYISIVGIDAIPFFYYRAKLEAERTIEASGIPFTILRATQFHSLIDRLITSASKYPFIMPLTTDFRFQTVDESEVASRIARAIGLEPGGRLRDFGGPEVQTLGEMARVWQESRGVNRKIMRIPMPGKVAAAFRAGRNTAPDGDRGTISWRDWLAKKQEKRNV